MPTASAAQSTSNLQQKTWASFATLSLITQACQSLRNTQFVAPTPKPAWFDGLEAKLEAAKANAQDWIDNIAPDVTGGVPVQVINYGTTYAALSAEIQSIVTANPEATGPSNPFVLQVNELVQALESAVTDIITKAAATSDSLQVWGDLMQKSHNDLATGTTSIQNVETDLTSDITKMNNAISNLNAEIAAENKELVEAQVAVAVGVFMTVVGVALAPATGGGSLVVAGIGGGLVIAGAVGWAKLQDSINSQFNEIDTDQKELNDDNRQLVALQGLSTASDNATQYASASIAALSDFRASWSIFQGELAGIREKLDKAETSLSTLLAGAFTEAANAEWADATAYAQSLADLKIQVEFRDLPMDSTSKAA